MTDKLNQSLDAIMTEGRANTGGPRRSRRPRRAAPSAKATKAPVGGVQKSKPTKQTGKATAAGPRSSESKIIVSNLVSFTCHICKANKPLTLSSHSMSPKTSLRYVLERSTPRGILGRSLDTVALGETVEIPSPIKMAVRLALLMGV